MNTDLMKIVESVVRPIHAPGRIKLRMREELYSQLEQMYLEESANEQNPQIALQRTCERFGNPGELRQELQATVPMIPATLSRFDRWFVGRREGESPLRHALRIGIRIGGAILVCDSLMMFLIPGLRDPTVLWHLWPFLAILGVLFGLNVFVMTLCGRSVLQTLVRDEGRLRNRRLLKTALCVLAVGLTLGFSEAVMWLAADSEIAIADAAVPFVVVTLIGVVSFLIVVRLMATELQQFRPWKELELSSE